MYGMLKGKTKTNKKHVGVQITKDTRTGSRDTLKWRSPETGKWKTQRHVGATQPEMKELAVAKAREIQQLTKRLADQAFVPVVDQDLVLEWLNDQERSERTRKNRKTVLPFVRRLEQEVIRGPITDCKPEDVGMLRVWIGQRDDLKVTTKNQYLLNISALFTSIIKNRRSRFGLDSLVVGHELRKFPMLSRDDQTNSSLPLQPSELQQGFAAIIANRPPEVQAYMALLYCTGMRASELADTSSWTFVDGDKPSLEVWSTKNAKNRTVTFEMSPIAADIVRALEARAESADNLFGHDGLSFSKSVGDFERDYLRKQLGFKFNAHRMRSSCGTYAMLLGIPDSLICRRMDHTAQTALLHYRVGAERISPVKGATTLEEAAGLSDLFAQIVENLRA
jgi:integrase